MPNALIAVPEQLTPEMTAAAAAAREGGADFAGQYQAALAAWRKPPVNRSRKSTVPPERGEALLRQLEDGMASPVARELFQCIVLAEKQKALRLFEEERIVGQDAEDLYDYCRQKWVTGRLVVAELPVKQAASVLRSPLPQSATLLVRQGLSVVSGVVDRYAEPLHLMLGRGDLVPLARVPQLWLVQPAP